MSDVLILPSPFLGPAPYTGLASALGDLGMRAAVATYDEPPRARRLVEQWTGQATAAGDAILVAHSNAGHLAPGVSQGAGGRPVVFVDAALPPSGGTGTLAPPELRDHLRGLADAEGQLPPWTRWWPRAELADVLPDAWYDRLDPVLPRVPVSYLDSDVVVPPGWEQGACGYLGFGPTTYAAELDRARAAGWPVAVLDGARHLHLVVEPGETAAAILRLAVRLA